MVALARSMAAADHPAEPCLVLSNRPEAGGLARAAEMGIDAVCVDHRAFPDRGAFDAAVTERLRAAGAEIVLMAGFMRIVTPDFIASLQRALAVRGYYRGPIHGHATPETRRAVRAYQAERGLDSAIVSIETARELGLTAFGAEGPDATGG